MNAILTTMAILAAATGTALSVPALADAPPGAPTTVLGAPNELLIAGATAMRNRQYREGIELTLSGLKDSNAPRDVAGALSNLCAAYAALKEFALALAACDQSLVIDRSNWRTWNNRAAVHLGQGRHDAAISDVQAGLGLAPNSSTLRRTLAIIESRKRATEGQDEKVIKA